MRLGFLGDTEYWFSGHLGDIYKPETFIPWYKESFVEKPYYEKYWTQADWAKAAKKAVENG